MDRMKKSKTDTHTIKSRQAKTDENAAIPFDRSNGELNEYTDNDKKKDTFNQMILCFFCLERTDKKRHRVFVLIVTEMEQKRQTSSYNYLF